MKPHNGMALLFISNSDDPGAWRRELSTRLGAIDMRIWPEAGDPAEIDAALVWKPEPGVLRQFPNLKLIQSLGMGVDHIFVDDALPQGVPVCRIVDRDMARQMAEYVTFAALWHHRRMAEYDRQQREGVWRQLGLADTACTTVGVMGLGVLGGEAVERLAGLGFRVAGWSRSPKSLAGIETFAGKAGFEDFIAGTDILVCLLPLTPDTADIVNARTLAAMPEGAYVINSARGGHVDEDALLAAVDSGHIAGATLDVFKSEPLPSGHPFWAHPRIRVTPHIAALTNPRTAAEEVAENLRRLRSGKPLNNVVDPAKGY